MQSLIKTRTKRFALDVIDLIESLPNSVSLKVISYQLVKSATSVGTNYRAVCRARSDNEFISKLQIVLEEADESGYWLELIQAKGWVDVSRQLQEANELTAIFVSSLKTIKNRSNSKNNEENNPLK
ncbi:four helix bundle protein [Belliella aquatica]|uniref:Four helix bundle protein n=1 Tax=Belliella aquatica TaxID=1323734 RepID=A0ABQ1MQ05_9BACT|nr:four helix bundle protein [Belliella aquatica]MCH7406183.1 four helix bundle protein [Belliella aquatica]GGC44620.1 four helix bundle protein [Belliella aquatica]